VILLMLWLYLSSLTLLVGAEIDALVRAPRGNQSTGSACRRGARVT